MRTVIGRTDRVVVIGAGLGGLSATLRLLGAGRSVTVCERASVPGGRAGVLERSGYRFDTGPTVLTMPGLIDDALHCVGESLADRVKLVPVDPLYRANFADGSTVDVHSDTDRMAAAVSEFSGASDEAGYRAMVEYVTRLYKVEMDAFIDRNIDTPFDLLGARLIELVRMGGFRKLAPTVARFISDPRLQRVFSFQSMYAGLSPYDALAIYAVITYMDSVAGVSFPMGGMHAVPTAMAAAADHGAEFRYDTDVTRIEIGNGRAHAVHTANGERIPADVVVVNADLPVAYRDLLPASLSPRRLRTTKYSPSCMVLHLGSPRRYPDAAHHNIHFGHAWRSVFRELIDRRELMTDPSILVTNPTHTDPSLAPPGRESYYVLAPAPNQRSGIDWSVVGPRYRDEILAVLERRGYPGLAEDLDVIETVTPADWEAMGLAAGAPFAATHSMSQTGPFRPGTLARGVENVVFTGSNTQPGVGVPMVLVSGRLAAERITGKPVLSKTS